MPKTARLLAVLVTTSVTLLGARPLLMEPASAADPAPAEFLCLKGKAPASLKDLAIACYSDRGCAYIESNKGEAIVDYDQASVVAALGREKIEGVVTASQPIMKQITGYGYTCSPLP